MLGALGVGALGVDCESFDDQTTKILSPSILTSVLVVCVHWITVYAYNFRLARHLQARRRLRAQVFELIRAARARHAQVNGDANCNAEVSILSGCKPGSFLDLLIHATNKETGKPFDDTQARAQR